MRFQFGDFTLDDDRRQLLAGDKVVHLSPKAYELLKALVEERPRALSKSELHERLWPRTFVSEVNLAALVVEVRAALGDRGRHGRFIRTVHGFGYAFEQEAQEEDDRAGERVDPPSGSGRRVLVVMGRPGVSPQAGGSGGRPRGHRGCADRRAVGVARSRADPLPGR